VDPELNTINGVIEGACKITNSDNLETTKLVRDSQNITKQFTRNLPESVSSLSGRKNRLLRRCFTLYGRLRRPQLRRAAIGALEQIPDIRMLRSALGYLIKLDYIYHDRIVADLIALLNAGDLPFPYQVAVTIEALGRTAPSEPLRLASQLRTLGLTGQGHWYVRQKTLEAILQLPYRQESAERLAAAALDHENPWVRRAGGALLSRGRAEWVRETVGNVLIYHPDPELSRVALFWQRHLVDIAFANREITNLFRSGRLDVTFLRRLKVIYLLRCNSVIATQIVRVSVSIFQIAKFGSAMALRRNCFLNCGQ